MTSHHLPTSPATEATPADLAALDLAYRERMDACPCPACIPPRMSGLPTEARRAPRRAGR